MKYKYKIVITSDGKTTTAAYYRDGVKARTAMASRHPDDAHDFKLGAVVAMDRLLKAMTVKLPADHHIIWRR